ncbi:MAG: 50S ribosomal protein L9 [Proteobacteria bacterium]|nr:50S ribosomal protein L9 [Pseudomonadota bacterium]
MKVILKETIESLGIIGSTVNVSDGYARNYLLPQKKAVLNTPHNLKMLEREKAKIEVMIAKEKGLAEEMAKKAIEINPRQGAYYIELGSFLIAQGKLKEEEDLLKKVADQDIKVHRDRLYGYLAMHYFHSISKYSFSASFQ